MRDNVPTPEELNGSTYEVTAEITYMGHAVWAPVLAGHLIWQADQWPAARVSFTIPRHDEDGEDLLHDGRVGTDGHNVRLFAAASNTSRVWRWELGRFLIDKITPSPGTLEVSAVLRTALVDAHKGAAPVGVAEAASVDMIIRTLCGSDNVTVAFDRGLSGVTVPKDFTIGTDRGRSLRELIEAWPAYVAPDENVDVVVRPIPTGTPGPGEVVTFSDRPGTGTVIGAKFTLERSQVTNHVIVPVKDSDTVGQAWARYGKYSVDTYGWQSRTIDRASVATAAHASIVAHAELQKALLRAVTVPVELFPDHRLEPYDLVGVTSREITGTGYITGLDIPLSHAETMVAHVGIQRF
ncbi:hypothetical protein ACRQFN_02335 [Actinotignum sp. GS-2025e]|uniref:hypothetical protein n=1 Tax=unclassified Actinotignum TaxID=2632702 RepID=UPI003F486773